MPAERRLSTLQRDALLAILALALLTAPLWLTATSLGAETYVYERAEVVIDDESGIAYANDTGVPLGASVSDEIACTTAWAVRPCVFEQYLASNNTVPSEIYTSNPGTSHSVPIEPYGYAQADGVVYETAYVANRSARNEDGMYRLDLALEPVGAEEALRSVSIDASTERPDAPSVAVEAAQEGRAVAPREIEVPQTPIRVDDGRYYRVYGARTTEPNPFGRLLRTGLSWLGPLVGLLLSYRLWGRIEVSYAGSRR
ncbi:hypothetical protein [Halorussus marinus]|uniref:hypothetical protein n=1 Tax=Halorussus marinus TaxID=2505976 RepID=UPI001091C1CC|nr:hypothetical protein [Halorussus marinus]